MEDGDLRSSILDPLMRRPLLDARLPGFPESFLKIIGSL